MVGETHVDSFHQIIWTHKYYSGSAVSRMLTSVKSVSGINTRIKYLSWYWGVISFTQWLSPKATHIECHSCIIDGYPNWHLLTDTDNVIIMFYTFQVFDNLYVIEQYPNITFSVSSRD